MSVLNWPAGVTPQHMEISLINKNQSFESELTGVRQIVALPGARWQATMTFSNLMGDKARNLRAFLASLGGTVGQFYMPAFGNLTPGGTALGTPLIKGAGQTGNTLVTDGWAINQAMVIQAGDYIQVGNLFFIATANAASNASGEASIPVAPEIRTSPADNAVITVNSPAATMQLVDNNQTRFAQQPGKIYAISIACREVLSI